MVAEHATLLCNKLHSKVVQQKSGVSSALGATKIPDGAAIHKTTQCSGLASLTSWYEERPASFKCDPIARLDNVAKEYVILSSREGPIHV